MPTVYPWATATSSVWNDRDSESALHTPGHPDPLRTTLTQALGCEMVAERLQSGA
jgi:hypothetical protein